MLMKAKSHETLGSEIKYSLSGSLIPPASFRMGGYYQLGTCLSTRPTVVIFRLSIESELHLYPYIDRSNKKFQITEKFTIQYIQGTDKSL